MQYLKTTLTGMTGSALDYAMLVVSGVSGVQRMTAEHLAIALALQVTKTGTTPAQGYGSTAVLFCTPRSPTRLCSAPSAELLFEHYIDTLVVCFV